MIFTDERPAKENCRFGTRDFHGDSTHYYRRAIIVKIFIKKPSITNNRIRRRRRTFSFFSFPSRVSHTPKHGCSHPRRPVWPIQFFNRPNDKTVEKKLGREAIEEIGTKMVGGDR